MSKGNRFMRRSISKKVGQTLVVQRAFRCFECGKIDVYEATAEPVCCSKPMRAERELFKGGDPNELRVDLVEIPGKSEEKAHWLKIYEVWFLKPGRSTGELLGLMGETLLAYEYIMVPGIASHSREGSGPSKDAVVEKMLLALDEG